MKPAVWNSFVKARERFRKEIKRLERNLPELQALQQELVDNRTPRYTVETPVVYNTALDEIGPDSEIKLILVGDNPGRREQMAENRRYLIGPSGKIAEKFFRDNPSLGIDFRKNVIILNKTPVHTPRTADLRQLCRNFQEKLTESQQFMARLLFEFHEAFACDVWITGYCELGKKGVFAPYTEELKAVYGKNSLKDAVFLYRHFSMNQFTVDLKRQAAGGGTPHKEPLTRTLNRIGTAYRERFFEE